MDLPDSKSTKCNELSSKLINEQLASLFIFVLVIGALKVSTSTPPFLTSYVRSSPSTEAVCIQVPQMLTLSTLSVACSRI